MKLRIDESRDDNDIEIIIKCQNQNDETVQKIICALQNIQVYLNCRHEKQHYQINLTDILYIESIDEKTFVYTHQNIYEEQHKLYELEEFLKENDFIRISKSCILNLSYLQSVRAMLNGKYEATLVNGEKLTINRSYMPAFKKAFGL